VYLVLLEETLSSLRRLEQTLSGETLPEMDLLSMSQSGQHCNSDFHSPVRGDLRDSCMKGWQRQRPSSLICIDASIGIIIVIVIAITIGIINLETYGNNLVVVSRGRTELAGWVGRPAGRMKIDVNVIFVLCEVIRTMTSSFPAATSCNFRSAIVLGIWDIESLGRGQVK
jgi:hypothetical protein